jgi:hypothetical protein
VQGHYNTLPRLHPSQARLFSEVDVRSESSGGEFTIKVKTLDGMPGPAARPSQSSTNVRLLASRRPWSPRRTIVTSSSVLLPTLENNLPESELIHAWQLLCFCEGLLRGLMHLMHPYVQL